MHEYLEEVNFNDLGKIIISQINQILENTILIKEKFLKKYTKLNMNIVNFIFFIV